MATTKPVTTLTELEAEEVPLAVNEVAMHHHNTPVRHTSMFDVGVAIGYKAMIAVLVSHPHVDAGGERSNHFFYRGVGGLS